MKSILITLIITVGACVISYMGGQTVSPKKVIYDVCQASRMHDFVSEQTCGDLQDYYHAEYLCKENNKKADNKCWVEVQ